MDLRGPGGPTRIEAQRLAPGEWLALLGTATTGHFSYEIGCSGPSPAEADSAAPAGPFEYEVGSWHEATAIAASRRDGERLVLTLQATGSAALLHIEPLADGVLALELAPGGDAAGPGVTTGDPQSPEAAADAAGPGAAEAPLRLTAPGLEAEVDAAAMELRCRAPGHGPGWQIRLPLRFRWLALADGTVQTLHAPLTLAQGEAVYGLGERFGPPDLRGRRLDVRVYEEYKEQGDHTYLPVPFFLTSGAWGAWLDEEEPSVFDFGGADLSPHGRIELAPRPAAGRSLRLKLLVADAPYGVVSRFVRLSGDIHVPPAWAFGPWMSSNSWNSQALTEENVARTLAEDVPATVLVIEAWSDESTFYIFNDAEYEPQPGAHAPRLADFRFGGRWPDPKAMIDHCREHGIRVVLWQIPVLKKLDGPHPQHDADTAWALAHGFGIRHADGEPYRNAGWWFTDATITDFGNAAERDWWFGKRRYLFDELGISGMKTDGGEHIWGSDLRSADGRRGAALVNTYARDYTLAYHDFVQERTGGDGVIFSRAGYTGAQRTPAHWAGDENSTWEAYRASVRAGIAAGLAGVSVWGWDLGGFSGDVPTPELYLRGTAMAALCPVMQYHSEGHGASENRDRTPWNIAERSGDPAALDGYRRFAQLRVRLIDYIHGEAKALAAAGLPLMRAPCLEYPAEHDRLAHDPYAYMFGRDLLVAPVVEKGQLVRRVLLPAGEWLDAWSGASFSGGTAVTVPAPLQRIPAFIRADSPRASLLLAAFAGG